MRASIGALVLAWWVSGAESTALAQGQDAGDAQPTAGARAAPSDAPAEAPLPPLAPPPYYDAPLPEPFPAPARHRARWGAAFRLEGAPMGKDAASNARMGGIGVSFRPRPSPSFAIDFGLDFLGGRDFNGERRTEQAFTIDPMVFLNPRSKVAVYLFAGLGVAGARVEHTLGSVSHYRYVGVNGGGGLELRFWRRVAIDADFLAFVRDRTDREGARYPEYVDARTGRFTNTSQGIVIRAGVAYYW